MRPLNSSIAVPQLSLDELAANTSADLVLLLALMPSGDLRVVRTTLGANPSLGRQYVAGGQFADRATWATLTHQPLPEAASSESIWESLSGRKHAIVAPVAGPLLAGYPGALVALGQKPFTDADRAALKEGARQIESDPASSAPLRGGRDAERQPRVFVVDSNGRFVGAVPTDAAAGIDATLAGQIATFAKRRVAEKTKPTGGERVVLHDASGEAHAFTIALFEKHAADAHDGRVLILCRVPHFSEWLQLRNGDFTADQEIGRLLPAFKFMHEHFHEGVTLPAIAKHVQLSPFHFHRRFTELLGITPKHFLYDCQIARAQEMLLASQHELETIAKLCGFAHQSHFTSRFKQATGLTPTRWRRLKHLTNRESHARPTRV